jgi:hypothetical protein
MGSAASPFAPCSPVAGPDGPHLLPCGPPGVPRGNNHGMRRASNGPAWLRRLAHTGALVAVALLVLVSGCTTEPAALHQAQGAAARGGLVVHVTARTSTPTGTALVVVRADAAHAPGALGYDVRFGDGTVAHSVVPQFCVAGPGSRRQATWHLTHRYAHPGTYHLAVTVHANCSPTVATARLALRVG